MAHRWKVEVQSVVDTDSGRVVMETDHTLNLGELERFLKVLSFDPENTQAIVRFS
jgi:predicted metal-dependent RNase